MGWWRQAVLGHIWTSGNQAREEPKRDRSLVKKEASTFQPRKFAAINRTALRTVNPTPIQTTSSKVSLLGLSPGRFREPIPWGWRREIEYQNEANLEFSLWPEKFSKDKNLQVWRDFQPVRTYGVQRFYAESTGSCPGKPRLLLLPLRPRKNRQIHTPRKFAWRDFLAAKTYDISWPWFKL